MFGQWLREQRDLRGWTQYDLARELKIAQPHISRLEQNRRKPTPDLVQTIARVFGFPPEEVFRRAYSEGQEPLDPLEELPPAVVAKLRELQRHLWPEDWEQVVAEAVFLARKNAARDVRHGDPTTGAADRVPPEEAADTGEGLG